MELGLKELLHILDPKDLKISGEYKISGFSIDSRTIKRGEVFVALKGERFDGHEFANDAVEKSGTFAIVERSVECPHILVDDTLEALKRIAAYNLKKSGAKSIAVVGSVGKTTTKELLADVLSCRFGVCKSYANENNIIGVCKTLLKLSDEDFCIVEVGVSKPGEMEEIANFFKPDGVLFLNVSRVHLEFFGSVEGVLEEKRKIVHDGALLVYNGDDELLSEAFKDRDNSFCFSFNNNCDFKARKEGDFLVVNLKEKKISLPLRDEINPLSVLASFSSACAFGDDIEEDCAKFVYNNFEPVGYRMRKTMLGSTLVILDCYNANVDSMKYAIDVLSKHEGRKLAVLGDMFELGNYGEQLHREVGEFLKGKGIDVVTIGKDARFIGDEMVEGFLKHFNERSAIVDFLKREIKHYDVVLFKASRGMRLEEIYDAVKV